MMYIGRLPKFSAASLNSDGASPAIVKYEVILRLILSIVDCVSWVTAVIAGKKIKLLRVENQPAKAARKMIQRFRALVNREYCV